jgi:hypothetical protein
MAPVRDCPLFTATFPDGLRTFNPERNSVYLYGTFEQRSQHDQGWEADAVGVRFVRIEEQGLHLIKLNDAPEVVALRDLHALKMLILSFGCQTIYLDITGLSHHVWAPLLRAAWECQLQIYGVYVEPRDYRFSSLPREGQIFDLSERIEGIAPLPGFTSFREAGDEKVQFVPLLGFEGTRFMYIMEQVQPPGGQVHPVIGVPGFRAEYPFHAYQGNQSTLADSRAWRHVRYARANCPFSLYYVLDDIQKLFPTDQIKIAPIGTKPHALGAVLYALTSNCSVEIIYDHPKRTLRRTAGSAACLVYSVSAFLCRDATSAA